MTEQTKKGLMYFGICLLVGALIFGIAALISSATKINNHNEKKYGVLELNLSGDAWDRMGRRQLVTETLSELNRIGPTIKFTQDRGDVTVIISSSSQYTRNCYAGEYIHSQRTIILHPTCISSNIEFKSTFMHEVGHALGLSHICRRDREVNDCSPATYGISIMNPGLDYTDAFENTSVFDEINRISSVPSIEVTHREVSEFKRIWNNVRF